jgi:hypothetical protein
LHNYKLTVSQRRVALAGDREIAFWFCYLLVLCVILVVAVRRKEV